MRDEVEDAHADAVFSPGAIEGESRLDSFDASIGCLVASMIAVCNLFQTCIIIIILRKCDGRST